MLYYKDMFFIRKKTNHKKAIEAWAVPGGKSATPQNHTQVNFGALNLIKAKPGQASGSPVDVWITIWPHYSWNTY